jgi:hypothetical protein
MADQKLTSDDFTTKTWVVEGEVTFAVKGEFPSTSREGALELYKKRVRETNTTHIKIISCTVKPHLPGWGPEKHRSIQARMDAMKKPPAPRK